MNPDTANQKPRRGGLFVAILAAVVSWGLTHTGHGHIDWEKFLSPQHICSLVGVIASVWGGWRSGLRSSRT